MTQWNKLKLSQVGFYACIMILIKYGYINRHFTKSVYVFKPCLDFYLQYSSSADYTLPASRLPPEEVRRVSTAVPDCFASYMAIYVSKSWLATVSSLVDPAAMHLNDPACTGEDYNETHYVLGASHDMCGTVATVSLKGYLSAYYCLSITTGWCNTPGLEFHWGCIWPPLLLVLTLAPLENVHINMLIF